MIREDVSSLAGSIFISYRRDDSGESAGRIYDWLLHKFPYGAVFKDVDSIPLGVDFREHLQSALNRCRVVLVLIGPKWSGICDPAGNRRLDNPADFCPRRGGNRAVQGTAACDPSAGWRGQPAEHTRAARQPAKAAVPERGRRPA